MHYTRRLAGKDLRATGFDLRWKFELPLQHHQAGCPVCVKEFSTNCLAVLRLFLAW